MTRLPFIPMALATAAVALLTVTTASAWLADDAAAAVQNLAADDYTTRQQAMHQLLSDNTLTEDRIGQWYAMSDTPEQRQRLLTIARHHVIRRIAEQVPNDFLQAGAVGITTNAMSAQQVGSLNQPAIHVSRRFVGFPAYAALQQDDLITHVNGQALPQTDDTGLLSTAFGNMIKSHKAGTVINLRLVRHGQVVEVPVKLAYYSQLQNIYQGGLSTAAVEEVEMQWQETKRRIMKRSGGGGEPAIRVQWDTPSP